MSAACPVYGFEFIFRLRDDVSDDDSTGIWKAFIDVVERHGLSAAGGGDVQWRHIIVRDGAQATDADRNALLEWSASQPGIVHASASPLIDLSDSGA